MKKILSIMLCIILALSTLAVNAFATENVNNQIVNEYNSSWQLGYGTESIVSGYMTMAYNDITKFTASTVLGKLRSDTGKKVVYAYCYGLSGYTRKFKLLTKKATNTSYVVSSLSVNTLSTGFNIDNTSSYVEKQASISYTVICDAQLQAMRSSTVGYISYPSVSVAI